MADMDVRALDRARLIRGGMDPEQADNLIGRAVAASKRKDDAAHAVDLARAEWNDASNKAAKAERDLRVALMEARSTAGHRYPSVDTRSEVKG